MSAGKMPMSEAMAFMLETPENPTHVGMIQIFEPVDGDCAAAVKRVLGGFRDSEVGAPFNLVPQFGKFGRAQWKHHDNYQPTEHIFHLAVPKPGSEAQLFDLVTRLHAGMMDRSKPCFQAYLIEGLEDNRFALYFKIQHAYLDGAALLVRFSETMSDSSRSRRAIPFWAPLPSEQAAHGGPTQSVTQEKTSPGRAMRDLGTMFGKVARRYRGLDDSLTPQPLSAPDTVFNSKVGKARSMGAGSFDFPTLRATAKKHHVTINDVVLTLVGDALERYCAAHGEALERELVATCPMSLRAPGDDSAGNKIAGIYVKLGLPGSELEARLLRVHESAVSAKDDARSVSSAALMSYLVLTGGTAELLGRTLPGQKPRQANVNVSNVAGPATPYYLSGCKMVRTYPVSTLAGGTAINITFGSLEGHMDYSVVADGAAIPDAQLIADYIADALQRLAKGVKPERGNAKAGKRQRKQGAAKTLPRARRASKT